MSFLGAEVLAFESRRANELAELIRLQDGRPFVAPALVEVPIADNPEAFAFADRLFAGEFELILFLTGVGARYLARVLATRFPEERFRAALRERAVAVRGPKPMAVMREWNVPVAVQVPEPNTWREVLATLERRPEKQIAVQEYGRSNPDLYRGLAGQGRSVTAVPVYQWALPPDVSLLHTAIDKLIAGEAQLALFTTSVQVDHLFQLAGRRGVAADIRAGLERMLIGSIGPTCTEALREHGLRPSLEPSHPKMGLLVREAAQAWSGSRLRAKDQGQHGQ